MDKTDGGPLPADALVIFGITGELVYKMIFPALYAMAKHGALAVPVIGVAGSPWSVAEVRKRARDSIEASGGIDDHDALARLLSALRYVSGDYAAPATFKALTRALGQAQRPTNYLAIPPRLFAAVLEGLGAAGLGGQGRSIIVENPFGRDLASAREINRFSKTIIRE